jgi:hypothetical protein
MWEELARPESSPMQFFASCDGSKREPSHKAKKSPVQ